MGRVSFDSDTVFSSAGETTSRMTITRTMTLKHWKYLSLAFQYYPRTTSRKCSSPLIIKAKLRQHDIYFSVLRILQLFAGKLYLKQWTPDKYTKIVPFLNDKIWI